MSNIVRVGLIQASNVKGPECTDQAIKKAMIDKHLKLIKQAAAKTIASCASKGLMLKDAPVITRKKSTEKNGNSTTLTTRSLIRLSCRQKSAAKDLKRDLESLATTKDG